MPHTTRRNYKDKLRALKEDAGHPEYEKAITLVDGQTLLIKHELEYKAVTTSLATKLAKEVTSTSQMLDTHISVNSIEFDEEQHAIDRELEHHDVNTILRRSRDVVEVSKDRIEVLSIILKRTLLERDTLLSRITALESSTTRLHMDQMAMYEIGPRPSSREKHDLESAQDAHTPYGRNGTLYLSAADDEFDDETIANMSDSESDEN